MNNRVYIFDTTLRDGQQCPGAGMSFADNITYAHLANELGIDILEAGFPSASKLDFDIVHTIAEELAEKNASMTVAGLCQLRDAQIEKTIEALLPAQRNNKARVHFYVPVSPELMQASVGSLTKEEILKATYKAAKMIESAGMEIEFSPEGYSRQAENFDFVTELIMSAIEGGATVINCPDTIGGAYRYEGKDFFVENMKKHADIMAKKFPVKSLTWSVHCHNDLGLAVENSITGVFEGPARQIECTINGVGERAGNTSLEQCAMIIKQFASQVDSKNPLYTGIQHKHLQKVSDFISEKMLKRQAHFPITGDNAARHTSGGHTNAILKNPLVYQPFHPEEVGKEISFVFGPLSGGNHAKDVINKAGYVCTDEEKAKIAQFIKDVFAERRKGITDAELLDAYFEYRSPMKIKSYDYARTATTSSVRVEGTFFDEEGVKESVHTGKESALKALSKAIDEKIPGISIAHYSSIAEGEGIKAFSVCTIRIETPDGKQYEGKGKDEDIEISAMKALVKAVNMAYIESNFVL